MYFFHIVKNIKTKWSTAVLLHQNTLSCRLNWLLRSILMKTAILDRCRASSGVLGKCQIISRVADSNLNFVKLSNLQSAIKPKAATAAWVSWSQPVCKENKLELTIQFTCLISKWFFSLAALLHQRTRVHSYLPNPTLTHAINPFLTDSIWPQSNHFLKTTIGLINQKKKKCFLYGILLVYYIFVPPCCTKQPVHWKRLSLLLATTTK